MAIQFKSHPETFHSFELHEYVDFVIAFAERLNPHFIIERFAGEVPPRYLYINNWDLIRNDQLLCMIEKQMENQNTWQGKYYKQ